MPGFNNTSVLLFCLVALVLAEKEQGERRLSAVSGDGDRLLDRRYAESTIASDMSKIMDSMVQKKFVNFLLTRREKKSEHSAAPEGRSHKIFSTASSSRSLWSGFSAKPAKKGLNDVILQPAGSTYQKTAEQST